MSDTETSPRLSLSHATLAVSDLDEMLAFYCDVLGFRVTDRGDPGDGSEMVFISQDPGEHHQIVLVRGAPTADRNFVLIDHLAFRTVSLDDLRTIGERLADAGVDDLIPVSHGNAWSLYFTDPEGNGLECFVDSPFHVAQPHGGGLDLDLTDADLEAATRAELEPLPGFAPIEQWRADFEATLAEPNRQD